MLVRWIHTSYKVYGFFLFVFFTIKKWKLRSCAQYIEAQYLVDVHLVHVFHTSINCHLAAIGLIIDFKKRCICEEHKKRRFRILWKHQYFFILVLRYWVLVYKMITVLLLLQVCVFSAFEMYPKHTKLRSDINDSMRAIIFCMAVFGCVCAW